MRLQDSRGFVFRPLILARRGDRQELRTPERVSLLDPYPGGMLGASIIAAGVEGKEVKGAGEKWACRAAFAGKLPAGGTYNPRRARVWTVGRGRRANPNSPCALAGKLRGVGRKLA